MASFAQGTVDFQNGGPGMLISFGPVGNTALLPANEPGSFYFGVLISAAPTGPFAFTGAYGTNNGFAGRLRADSIPVPGWAPFTTMFYEVAGWSASLGVAWNPGWLVNNAPADENAAVWGARGYFGLSGIGVGQASGQAALPVPPFPLFGGISGFNLAPVGTPEPSSFSLMVFGWGAFLSCRGKAQRRLQRRSGIGYTKP